jgi:ABC-type polysaccharide/polyol phosphate transport system ATPase subunit
VSGKSTLSALLLEESIEITAGELATMIRPKTLDLGAMLSTSLGCKSLVSFKGLLLGMKQFNMCVA